MLVIIATSDFRNLGPLSWQEAWLLLLIVSLETLPLMLLLPMTLLLEAYVAAW
jgi:hypothetical protein